MGRSSEAVFLLFSLLFMAAINRSFSTADLVCSTTERKALLNLKKGFKDPSNWLSSWDSNNREDCCRWKGVGCDNRTGHVVQLKLRGSILIRSLSGEINHHLLELKHLRYLDLSGNEFEGNQIPDFLGSLQKLRYLNLSNSGFGGVIPPQFGNLSSLRYLDLRFCNALNVDNLHWVSRLSSLRYLDMNSVDLRLAHDWLQVINMLPHLSQLYLSSCQLSNIPPLSIVNFTSLVVLDLSWNKFGSTIPDWLYDLTSLEHLILDFNKFQGTLSPRIGNLTSLTEVSIYDNSLNGSIPSTVANLCNLRTLILSLNRFSGEIFRFLGNSSGCMSNSLESLRLEWNQLNETIPKSIGNLSRLELLDISGNPLQGIVSENHFARLIRLKILKASSVPLSLNVSTSWVPPFQLFNIEVGSWKLGPQFPAWLQTQKDFSRLNLSNTGISDTIPNWFWKLSSQIFFVDLSHNQIHGSFPGLSRIQADSAAIYLGHNRFTGLLPRFTSGVVELDLSNNLFSGSITHFLCDQFSEPNLLEYLDLSNNLLSGEIPDCWMNWQSLNVLNLGYNNLSGNLPKSLGSLTELQSLHLRNNGLIGELPSSLQNCTELLFINIGQNEFFGRIPVWIGQSLPKLMVLSLRSNKFNGSIPLEICHLSGLQIMDLSHNKLSGSIPQCFNNFSAMASDQKSSGYIGYVSSFLDFIETASLVMKGMELYYSKTLTLVTSMDLSDNSLSGVIPEDLTRLLGLRSLNLSLNHLVGRIPQKIGEMEFLESLDFSSNQLSGVIPQSLSNLTFLSHLNLSNNNLSGRIPSGTQIQGFTASSFLGNKGLCGSPLTKGCTGDDMSQIPTGGGGAEGDKDDNGVGVAADTFFIAMVLGFVMGFWGVFGPILFIKSLRFTFFRFLDRVKQNIHGGMIRC